MLFSFVKNFMSAFDQAQFDKEVSRDFDTQEIASATARYEKEAAQLVKDVCCFFFKQFIFDQLETCLAVSVDHPCPSALSRRTTYAAR
ncbi:hypothetical protein Y032_0142g2340 [Ancylostoma ceylanicum]|nr:hypothetical protein Y032_0142g2340 [Ancylostoma ceylanicum]